VYGGGGFIPEVDLHQTGSGCADEADTSSTCTFPVKHTCFTFYIFFNCKCFSTTIKFPCENFPDYFIVLYLAF